MMSAPYPIVDADSHHMEPESLWNDYIEAPFKSRAPRREDVGAGFPEIVVEDEPVRAQEGKYRVTPAYQAMLGKARKRFKPASKQGFSPRARLTAMDDVGVDIQILNPTVGGQLLGREYHDPELLAAICRAYNDWSAEYCQADPARLKWIAMLPIQAPGLALAEMH
ncbi:MAG: hypothetical protein MJE66_17760, partial [Proteobacteria bacterium]|nr:hypothetical protein [Pseudomonadota bacterium]